MRAQFRLPGHDEMGKCLLGVDSNDDVTAGFYSRLLNQAGKEHTSESFAEAFVQAMRDYTKVQMAQDVLLLRVDEYAHALIENHDIAEQVSAAISLAAQR